MNGENRKMCRFCPKTINDDEGVVVDETIKQMLNMLIPRLILKPNLDVSGENVVCSECANKLQNAVNFKSMCFSSENNLTPKSEDVKFVLKEDKWEENTIEDSTGISDGQNICRFCKKSTKDECYSHLKEKKEIATVLDMVRAYIPELHSIVIEELTTCKNCLDSLQSFLNFINCLGVDENWKQDVDQIDVKIKLEPDNIQSSLKTEVVGDKVDTVKSEESVDNDDDITVKDEVVYIKLEGIDKPEPKVEEESEIKSEENQHERCQGTTLKRKSRFKKRTYKCTSCSFETKYPASHKRHMMLHQESERKTFKCEICSLTLRTRFNLNRHMLTHQKPSEVQMYQCESCRYQTKHKNCMTRHVLKHRNPSEILMYKCDKCKFQTRHKNSHRNHLETHQSPSERTIYKCEKCPFDTKVKYTFIRHMRIHERTTETIIFTCKICPFKTKHSYGINSHMSTHRSRSELKMYQCDICPFKTKYSGNLKQHSVTHINFPEVKKYKCEVCPYETRLKGSLVRHMQIHRK